MKEGYVDRCYVVLCSGGGVQSVGEGGEKGGGGGRTRREEGISLVAVEEGLDEPGRGTRLRGIKDGSHDEVGQDSVEFKVRLASAGVSKPGEGKVTSAFGVTFSASMKAQAARSPSVLLAE